ncbi:MAG: stage V sporulation protein AA [Clostridiales bacterium]|nr:stage V sporulation protein AA [Clostridiales bacterium]
MSTSETLYVKVDKNVKITSTPVHLGEIAQFSCVEKEVGSKVKALRLPTERIRRPGRYVYSILEVIEVIQREYPKLEISNLGETDFILTLEKTKGGSEIRSWIKTVLICFLSFFGAAFSIMAFNTDVGITELFSRLYQMFTGSESNGFTMLEISYSVGVGLGILIFFHHFARKRKQTDPTPLQVQMRTYEDDVNTTLIETKERSTDICPNKNIGSAAEKTKRHG